MHTKMISINYFLKKNIIFIFAIFFLNPAFSSSSNIAFQKPYSVSPIQNYHLSAPSTDRSILTDGKYTDGHFWTQKTTLGWFNERVIEILIDLQNTAVIDYITLNSAHGTKGGVQFPESIDVFIGNEKNEMTYAGDMMHGHRFSSSVHEVKKFKLAEIAAKGRYVLIIVRPKGTTFFCDEIEIHQGTDYQENLDSFTTQVANQIALEKIILKNYLNDFKATNINDKSLVNWIENTNVLIHKKNLNLYKITKIIEDLKKININSIKKANDSPFIIKKINPWGKITPFTISNGDIVKDISLLVAIGGYDTVALAVINTTGKPQKITLETTNNTSDIRIYHAQYIKTASMQLIADPLVPILDSLTISANESAIIYINLIGKKSGVYQETLKLQSEQYELFIPIHVKVNNLFLQKDSLSSVNWSYLEFQPIHDRIQTATKDLANHHTNVLVVPPALMQPTDIENYSTNFLNLTKYIHQHSGIRKTLLFMNLKSDIWQTLNGTCQFMDEKWKYSFQVWYKNVMSAITKSGINQDSIYIYPFDEMSGVEIEQFKAFAKWVKTAFPEIKIYATLGAKNSEDALPYLDIAQIINEDNKLKQFTQSAAELWLYNASGPAKSNSPYSYYRLTAWKAFLLGYTGIGFWAYADTGFGNNASSAWDDFDGKSPDYSVIYDGVGKTIVSSRRWEAWRVGIEDYELLNTYAKSHGLNKAKALAKYVLDQPDDVSRADEIRHKIIEKIAN